MVLLPVFKVTGLEAVPVANVIPFTVMVADGEVAVGVITKLLMALTTLAA
jgi:hypothetical protein